MSLRLWMLAGLLATAISVKLEKVPNKLGYPRMINSPPSMRDNRALFHHNEQPKAPVRAAESNGDVIADHASLDAKESREPQVKSPIVAAITGIKEEAGDESPTRYTADSVQGLEVDKILAADGTATIRIKVPPPVPRPAPEEET